MQAGQGVNPTPLAFAHPGGAGGDGFGHDGGHQLTIDEFMSKFNRGNRPQVLNTLKLRSFNSQTVQRKIASMGLSGAKASEMSSLCSELTTRLTKRGPRLEANALKQRIESLVVEWGLRPSTVSEITDYGLLAKLLALAVVTSQ